MFRNKYYHPTADQASSTPVESGTVNNELETTIQTPIVKPEADSPTVEVEQENVSDNSVDALPEWAQDLIHDLRNENASRRVAARESDQKLGEYLGAIQELLTNINGNSNPASEGDVSKAEEVESTPPAANEFLETVMSQLQNLSYDNALMRVVSETGLSREIVETLQGRTYDDLLANATKIKNSIKMPSEETSEPKTQSNKPPKAPITPVSPDTEAVKRGRYFGTGVATNAPVFGKTNTKFFEE